MSLPRPFPNKDEYMRIMTRGFERFPVRYDNYKKYSYMKETGYKEIVSCMPIKMDYEVSSICNFRCRMCLISEVYDRKRQQMKLDDYIDSLDEQYGLIEVKLQGLGEPLLNKNFFEMVQETVKRDIWVRTTINGSLLHVNDNYKKMIDSKIGEIQVSIDGATKKTFEYIRRGSNFEQVVENVKKMNEYAKEKGEVWRSSCWILLQRDNFHEMEKFLDLAKYMKFSRVVYSLDISDWGGVRDWQDVSKSKTVINQFTEEMGRSLIRKGKEKGLHVYFWSDSTKYQYDENRDKLCDWIFGRSFITGDMRVAPCCVISDADSVCMGSAKKFKETWNSDTYKKFRKEHLNGNIPSFCKMCYQ